MDDTYTDCEICDERFGSGFGRYIRTIELPNGECQDVCISCLPKRMKEIDNEQ